MQTVYETAGGDDGLLRLARAWHGRVMADEVVSHAFSHGFHPQHSERLAAYWAEALGGPATYTTGYGDETSAARLHSGNGRHDEMDRRAIDCFDQALVDVGLADDHRLRQVLHDYFSWATTTMSRYHHSADDVPEGLQIPHWSWQGLVRETARTLALPASSPTPSWDDQLHLVTIELMPLLHEVTAVLEARTRWRSRVSQASDRRVRRVGVMASSPCRRRRRFGPSG